MNQFIARTFRHWNQSRTRAALQDRFGVLIPLLTMAGLTVLLWRLRTAGPPAAALTPGEGA